MRNFVIAGAGEVGRGIAQALIYERKNVIIVDPDPDALKQASTLECLLISGDILTPIIKFSGTIRFIDRYISIKNFERPVISPPHSSLRVLVFSPKNCVIRYPCAP